MAVAGRLRRRCFGGFGFGGKFRRQFLNAQTGNLAFVGFQDFKSQAVELQTFADFRQSSQLADDQSGDRGEIVRGKLHAKFAFDFPDFHVAAYHAKVIAFLEDFDFGFLRNGFVFVFDFSDDFFDQIFQRYRAQQPWPDPHYR